MAETAGEGMRIALNGEVHSARVGNKEGIALKCAGEPVGPMITAPRIKCEPSAMAILKNRESATISQSRCMETQTLLVNGSMRAENCMEDHGVLANTNDREVSRLNFLILIYLSLLTRHVFVYCDKFMSPFS